MAAFTINQKQVGKNLYLYPNGDLATCTEFTAVGDNPNYKCVDENRLAPDEDTTYVWWNGIVAALDLYELQDSTTETGTINYVQIFARGKSHNYSQSIDGVYKIICSPDSDCANVYKSDDINLTNNYTTYNKVWATNPDDDDAWEWTDIDLLCIGVECSSPSISSSENFTFRPSAAGDLTECGKSGDATNWECVDDTIPDNFSTYVYDDRIFGGDGERDLYNIPDNTQAAAYPTINSVTIFSVVKHGDDCCDSFCESWSKLLIKTGGTIFESPEKYPNYLQWNTFSHTWTTNPTGGAWSWADIDALQIGVRLQVSRGYADCHLACTQVYMIINASASSLNPEIRTTQCYAKVNYDDEVECTPNKPEQISTNHARNVKMLNFWNGSREVYDLNRSGKSMVLTGRETGSAACDTIICIRNMARDGNIITISELNPNYFNGDCRITSFGWNEISEKPSHFKWILELEDEEL